ncbi:hypothetical protein [Marinigracilibium pacificum]|uniref:Uncharacterized protein n=1 Tax=Marinigracilibium pacificum TaxID=2729599 RepID=A0A848J797_9BACT|nr:hypothetical protein [Marinigracilibium pacificum]NMM48982.1 hypothetical protein [Marinigracilibium pacificum]
MSAQSMCGAKNDPVYAADIVVGRAEYNKYKLEKKAYEFMQLYFEDLDESFSVSDSVIFIPLKLFLYELSDSENRKDIYDSLRILDSYYYFKDYTDRLIPHSVENTNQSGNILYFSKPENNRITAMIQKTDNDETIYFLFLFNKENELITVKSVNSAIESNRKSN